MSDSGQPQYDMVVKLRNSLEKVVDLGYGEDHCGHAVSMIFEDLARQAVAPELNKPGTAGPRITKPNDHLTCCELLAETNKVVVFLDNERQAKRQIRSPVVFPFLTTLGITGGMFLLTFHVIRMANAIFPSLLPG